MKRLPSIESRGRVADVLSACRGSLNVAVAAESEASGANSAVSIRNHRIFVDFIGRERTVAQGVSYANQSCPQILPLIAAIATRLKRRGDGERSRWLSSAHPMHTVRSRGKGRYDSGPSLSARRRAGSSSRSRWRGSVGAE